MRPGGRAVDDMYTMEPTGRYWFRNGFNPNGVIAVLVAGVPTVLIAILPKTFVDLGMVTAGSAGDIQWMGNFAWFIGCGLGFVAMVVLERVRPMLPRLEAGAGISDGTVD